MATATATISRIAMNANASELLSQSEHNAAALAGQNLEIH
jgi:hypothetical protein